MKKSILLFTTLLIAFSGFAQKYKKMGYLNAEFENKDVKIVGFVFDAQLYFQKFFS